MRATRVVGGWGPIGEIPVDPGAEGDGPVAVLTLGRLRPRRALPFLRASAGIEAPIGQVWAVVEDVLSAPEWQDGLKDVEELDRDADGNVTRVESFSDAKVRTVKSIVRFAYDGPARLSWRQEKGDLKSVEG